MGSYGEPIEIESATVNGLLANGHKTSKDIVNVNGKVEISGKEEVVRGRTRFHRAIEKDGIVLMPGCFDALSAAIIQRTGFSAAFISGYAVSATLLGMPDIGLLT